VIDLPPGTGDVQLTLIQTAPITGAIVVTTPSAVSLEDARKAIHMFAQVKVEILGIVENMSYLLVPGTTQKIDVFGLGAGRLTATSMGVNFLGEIALDPEVRIGGDTGKPVRVADGDPRGADFFGAGARVVARLDAIGPQTGPDRY
jgi:ATP-binding protein involved in chromosome partitioning